MSQKLSAAIAAIGIDIGKNSFHIVGHDHRGAIVLRQKWSRGQVETRLANLPPCLIGMEACVGAHHLSRKLQMPSGRSPPFALGIITRRTGSGRYVFETSSARKPANHASRLCSSMRANVIPSTPGAPALTRASR